MRVIGSIIKALLVLFDWRGLKRRLTGKSYFDVVFVSNMRDVVDRDLSIGLSSKNNPHFSGLRIWFDDVAGMIRMLNFLPKDLKDKSNLQDIKYQFISAVYWAKKKGAKVILLAAGTKRIFGRYGEEIKSKFPDITFTIGDNGTLFLLISDIKFLLKKAKLNDKENVNIAVIGCYGVLGEGVVNFLKKEGFRNVFGVGARKELLDRIQNKYKISTYNNLNRLSDIDLVVACTHNPDLRLTYESIKKMKKKDRKLLVIDVAEPANLGYREYKKSKNIVFRMDGGFAYSNKLRYVLGYPAYKALRMNKDRIFGCFAEAFVLTKELIHGNDNVSKMDWFVVDDYNMETIRNLFNKHDVKNSYPTCFSRRINNIDL